MKVKLCFNEKVGIGIQAVYFIPRGTKVLYYYGEVWNTQTTKEKGQIYHSHFLTVPGTGCSINGSFEILVPEDSFGARLYDIPAPFMSLPNSSRNYKTPNCKMPIEQTALR